MNTVFSKILTQINEFFKNVTIGKKVAVVITGLALLGIAVLIFMWAGTKTYVPLMSNLNPEDSTNIIRILRDKHIPFTVDPSGRNISIPSDSVYELRLELATMGLPQSSVVGYEIFDKQSLGTPSFVQKINQKRAQEGELTRTINTIRGVRRSRVHLAIPQKSTFVEDQKRPTASVVVDLDAGVVLTDKQVYGIGNMVARAVEGMDINDVVIMNSDGKILSKNNSDPLASATASQLEFQDKVQSDLERRVENMLSRIVGEGRVAATVTADLDFSQVHETQTTYDADGAAVVSVEKHNDNMNGTRPGPYGVSGNASNAPGQPPVANGEVKTETSKTNEVTNYKVPEIIRRTTKSIGVIKRLSVAVVVDGKKLKSTDKDGKVTTKNEDWPPEKLKEFEAIAASAVGLDKKRGDTLEVKNIEFSQIDLEEAQRVLAEQQKKSFVEKAITYGVMFLIGILFFFFVAKPFIRWITENTSDSVDTLLPQTIEELERLHKNTSLPVLEEAVPILPETIDPVKVEGEMIKEKIISLVDANPHKAALILRDWLHGEQNKKRTGDPKADERAKGKEKAANA